MATTGSAAPAAEPPAAAEAAAPATTVAEAPAATKLAEPQAAPEPAPVTASAPAPEPASEPAKKAPAAAPHRTAKAAPAPAVHHQRVTPSPLIKPAAPAIWWAQGTTSQQGFTLSFAGEASFTKAIVLLFSQPVDAASAATIRVVGKNGTPVSGSWTVSSKNPSLLVFEAPAGTYVLTVPTTVKSTQGTALGRTFGGPLTLH
ncbi:MAG: hypothetical protein EPN72_13710 [Nevskiaceae bacterium]|nr:MAG: hypothetical protein EPN63_14040 [Nevskiaceae bacterium]TBR71517.1 MAG: hypothetical protein EPN72_13710 [Nevskiaceae bacterium]